MKSVYPYPKYTLIFLFVGGLAGAGILCFTLLSVLPMPNYLYPYLLPLGMVVFAGLVIGFYVRWGWKSVLFRRLTGIPNLNGRYNGVLESTFANEHLERATLDCVVEIHQTGWTLQVNVFFRTNHKNKEQTSRSNSVTASVLPGAEGLFVLTYLYHNDPEIHSNKLDEHSGTVSLRHLPNEVCLKGEYYNRRGNRGSIKVRRVSPERLGRF